MLMLFLLLVVVVISLVDGFVPTAPKKAAFVNSATKSSPTFACSWTLFSTDSEQLTDRCITLKPEAIKRLKELR